MKRFLAIVVAVILGPSAAYAMIPPPPSSDHGVERGGTMKAVWTPHSVQQFALATLADKCPAIKYHLQIQPPEGHVVGTYADDFLNTTDYAVVFHLANAWAGSIRVTVTVRHTEPISTNEPITDSLLGISSDGTVCGGR